jgi:hypothetical protein
MQHDYGPTSVALPQTRAYVHHYLTDLMTDGAEPPIDAIVQIRFDSPETMREALATDAYKHAHELREAYMLDTSIGIHSAVVDRTLTLV